MAKMLSPDEVDFRRTRGDSSWVQTEWFNGQPWMLTAGEDFTAKTETVRTRLYNEATAKNLGSHSKALGNGDIIFQAFERTPEQIEASRLATEKRNATRAANVASGKTKPRGGKQKA